MSSADPLATARVRAGAGTVPEGGAAALRGWRALSATDHRRVGLLHLCTSLAFFALGGVLALMMRYQLASPAGGALGAGTYEQVFTMHGVVMLLLFAVPVVQAIGVRLLPSMLGARDLPFPRLAAFAFWLHAACGVLLFATLLFHAAPDAGWILVVPLSSYQSAPAINADFWLAAVTLASISALAGAVQVVIAVLRTRAPGMPFGRMPPYAWAVLVAGVTSAVAFAPLLVATGLLALERALHWPFFIAEKGGDPLLWQHLSRLFGYPVWCIVLLPVAGLVSTMVPRLARTGLVGRAWIVSAFFAAAALGFGVAAVPLMLGGAWSALATAAPATLAIPGAIVLSAWIATFMRGSARLSVSALHLLGGMCALVLGGLAGLIAVAAPFVQDTYFAVAQLHYVLTGGLLFPLCAALYYRVLPATGTEHLGRLAFAALFIGVNLCFLPMLVLGLAGMPRRVYTYAPGMGWEGWNQVATGGAFLFAAGVVLALVDLLRRLRGMRQPGAAPGREAARFEWLARDRSVRDDIADPAHSSQPGAGALTALITSAATAKPEYVLRLPGRSWLPMLTAVAAAAACFLLALRLPGPAAGVATFALAGLLAWLWRSDRPPRPGDCSAAEPVARTAPALSRPHSWWAMLVTLAIDAAAFLTLASCYVYLWTSAAGPWPPLEQPLPILSTGAAGVILWVTSSALFTYSGSALAARGRIVTVLAGALLINLAALAITAYGFLAPGLVLQSHASAALVGAVLAYQALHCAAATVMVGFLAARAWTGALNPLQHASFDNVRLFFQYTALQGVVAAALLYLLPRLGG